MDTDMTPSNIVTPSQELTVSDWDDRSEWEQVLSEGRQSTEEQPAFREYCDLFFRYAKKSPSRRFSTADTMSAILSSINVRGVYSVFMTRPFLTNVNPIVDRWMHGTTSARAITLTIHV